MVPIDTFERNKKRKKGKEEIEIKKQLWKASPLFYDSFLYEIPKITLFQSSINYLQIGILIIKIKHVVFEIIVILI